MLLQKWGLLAALTAACLLAGRLLIHDFQLESYQFPGYFRALRRKALKALMPGLCLALFWLGTMAALCFAVPANLRFWLTLAEIVLLVAAGWLIRQLTRNAKAQKKPLVMTPRLKRLYMVSAVVFFLVARALFSLVPPAGGEIAFGSVVCASVLPLLLPLFLALAGLLAWPIEKLISELYFRDAQKVLKSRPDLIRIGITGSWGKTSVKFILGTLLEEKYHTLVTPASFNTPMGVTKVIRTQLEPGHRVFVAEMGARHVGDIKEMCRLVRPSWGVLTSVGPQHLDTFKSLDRVKKTKYELIQALPKDGEAFFGDDGDICLELYQQTKIGKHLAGLSAERDDVWAEDIRTTPEGSRFILCAKDLRQPCETKLLGELNIRNILLAASVCLKMGLNGKQLARGIARLEPVEHRLQMIANPAGITVIDDAFNSNIRGAAQAFSVLKEMPKRRIAVTPGMVELGEQETELNHQLGVLLADCCDEAILIGPKRSEPIVQGLREANFPEEQIHVVASLEEARVFLANAAKKGDTILFENDLPDQYSE